MSGREEWSPFDLPCEFCGEKVVDHTPSELRSCVMDIKARQYEVPGGQTNRRNATPWLPPLSCDPRLTSVPRVGGLVTQYIVRNGPGGLTFTYDDLRDALVDLGRYVVACNAMHRSQERRQVLE